MSRYFITRLLIIFITNTKSNSNTNSNSNNQNLQKRNYLKIVELYLMPS